MTSKRGAQDEPSLQSTQLLSACSSAGADNDAASSPAIRAVWLEGEYHFSSSVSKRCEVVVLPLLGQPLPVGWSRAV